MKNCYPAKLTFYRCLIWLLVGSMALQNRVVLANPMGGSVAAGQATINSSGNTLTVNQTSSRAVINWQDFSINSGELTKFNLPNSASVVLNRVTGGNPSNLLGSLQSNGRVFLINPNGIVVGQNATINVAGLVASTLDVSNVQFMQGGDLTFSGNSTAKVVNFGTIRALEGDIYMIANSVENHGVLQASQGTVGLAAGSEVKLVDSAHQHLVVRVGSSSEQTGVTNTGTIEAIQAELAANGGNVYALAINNTGTLRATGSETINGRIYLTAPGGTIANSGSLIAKSGDKGGTIAVLADQVVLTGANIDASGANGGGEVLIGGDFQGKGEVYTAQNTTVDTATVINADATASGNGGKVIVWADNSTSFAGSITARGGGQSGDGGFAEVSGKDTLSFTGLVDLSAASGQNGTLLLDPTDFIIGNVERNSIQAILRLSNVVISTNPEPEAGNGDVSFNAQLTWTTDNSLTVLAHGDIYINGRVVNQKAGTINLVAGWDGTSGWSWSGGPEIQPGVFDIADITPGSFGNNSGSVYLDSSVLARTAIVYSKSGNVNVYSADLVLTGSAIDPVLLGSLQGYTSVVATRDVILDANGTYAQIGVDRGGNATGNISVQAGRNVEVKTTGGVANQIAQIGHGTKDGSVVAYGGNINVGAGENLSLITNADNATAQIGHGGYGVLGSVSGQSVIDVQAGGNLELGVYDGTNGTSQIGHGGWGAGTAGTPFDINANSDVNVTVAGNFLWMYAGWLNSVDDSTVQIGHGGHNFTGSIGGSSANINIQALNGWADLGAYFGNRNTVQIGHGGYNAALDISVNSNITLDINLLDVYAWENDTTAQVGHGGRNFLGSINAPSAKIDVTASSDVDVWAGSTNSTAQIGHGGWGAGTVTTPFDINTNSDIDIIAGRKLWLQTGYDLDGLSFTADDSTAQIGHGGRNFTGSIGGTSANINVQVLGGLTYIEATLGDRSTVQIGHGGWGSALDISVESNVTVNAFSDLLLYALTELSWAQIGHGGYNWSGSFTGLRNIQINAATIDIQAPGLNSTAKDENDE